MGGHEGEAVAIGEPGQGTVGLVAGARDHGLGSGKLAILVTCLYFAQKKYCHWIRTSESPSNWR